MEKFLKSLKRLEPVAGKSKIRIVIKDKINDK